MLVDDHKLMRRGLKLILEAEPDIRIIEEASDGNEAINKALNYKPDVIIMDINMPILNGLDSLKKMKEFGVSSKVIILTAFTNKEYIIAATKIGAKGYLFKNADPCDLIKAIREVSKGRSYIELSVANILSYGSNDEGHSDVLETDKINLLSRREYEVLVLLSKGYNNKEIGKELFISEKTVKNHITNIFKKLEVNDRVQATLFALHNSIK
jgi:DNA-binding NarL/FixJ family response regulator